MKNKTIWSNRFKNKTSLSFQKIGSSVHIDKRLYKQDIAASIVHVQMLIKQKIIKNEDGKKIINGLKKIKFQIEKGNFEFKEKFEDIHLNIEKALFEIIDDKKRLILVPVHDDFIIKVDRENSILILDLPDGLLDIYKP